MSRCRGRRCPSRRCRLAPLTRLAARRRARPDADARRRRRACRRGRRGTGCDGRRDTRALDHADSLARVDVLTTCDVVARTSARNTPTEGATITRSGTSKALAVHECQLHAHRHLRECGEIVGGRDAAGPGRSGTVRLASAASIEPWPTSRNWSAPRPGERLHRGTPAHRDRDVAARRERQPSASVVGRGVVVRDDRRGGRRQRRRSASSAARPSAASRISGVWNAPPTFSGVARLTPSSLACAEPASTPSGVPAITTWPGALSFATQHASGAAAARVLGLLERRAEQRGHATRMGVGGRLRELGPPSGEPHARPRGAALRPR